MRAALECDNLVMLQHIHALHPAPLGVHTELLGHPAVKCPDTLGLAFRHGTLETVQWVVEHRSDRACCPPGVGSYCHGCLLQSFKSIGDRDTFRIVMWLFDTGFLSTKKLKKVGGQMWTAMMHSTELALWLADRALVHQRTILSLFSNAVEDRRAQSAIALLDLIPVPLDTWSAQNALLRASFLGLEDVVDKLLSLGHCDSFRDKFVLASPASGSKILVQWDPVLINVKIPRHDWTPGGTCCTAASKCCNLVALQWLFHKHGIPPAMMWLENCQQHDEQTLLDVCKWMKEVNLPLSTQLMDNAAANGMLALVRWLHENSTARFSTAAIDNAAAGGHLDVIDWLYSNDSEGCTPKAMVNAATRGHLNVLQWLHRHSQDLDRREAMVVAAKNGHLDVLVWLTRTYPLDWCPRCIRKAFLKNGYFITSEHRSLAILRWIDSRPPNVCAKCRVSTVHKSPLLTSAVQCGKLELCEYLFQYHREKIQVVDQVETACAAAKNGHLGTLEWIYENFMIAPTRGDEERHRAWCKLVIKEARTGGHDHIIKWVRNIQAVRC